MLQGQEIFVILLVALVVLGPQRLPQLARKLGTWTAELRRAARDLRVGLEAEVGDLREVADEVRAPVKDVKQAMRDVRGAADDATKPIRWIGPEPQQGATPADAAEDLEKIETTGEALSDQPDEASSDDPSQAAG